MSVKSIVFLAVMVFAIMASAAKRYYGGNTMTLGYELLTFPRSVDLPRAAGEKAAVIDSPRGLGNRGIFGKIVARQQIITITATATADGCAPDPVTSGSSQVSAIQSTVSPVPIPETTSPSSVAVPFVSETPGSSADPLVTSSSMASSTPPASRVTPSESSPVASETATPPVESNLAASNGGYEGAILAGAAGFAALMAL
ncbi:hypothetical protein ACJ72_02483 [Emergomyces africanus]|uniref:Uncharacterized protein n=1 Tax=Emergomyces africanus TaxID=1955775 RepID=A0A1B7P2A5_9EURO|nr:hypothetical protein ACJ72_02483 [Emergomyces africanus]